MCDPVAEREMDLHKLIEGLPVECRGSTAGVRVGDLTEDSRTVLPGSLFVARPGLTSDGRRFIESAITDGAIAILTDGQGAEAVDPSSCVVLVSDDVPLACALLAERFFGDPSSALKLVAITGTNGKTTVAHLAHGLLNASGHRCGLIGTVSIDDGRETADAEMTTMPAIELSRTLASMVEHGCECAVMEISSHAIDQRRAAALHIDAAIFTTLGSDHLDYHKTVENYAAVKARLFASLAENATAIVNADDPAHRLMLEHCHARAIRCSTGRGDASATIESRGIDAMRLALDGPFGRVETSLPMTGDHNAMNLLQAVCAAHTIGARPEELLGALCRLTPPPGRMERVASGDADPSVFVDFAHTADALESTLGAARHALGTDPARPKLWVVFGCGGDRDRSKRAVMGETASRLADRVVLTSDNPRSERPSEIISQIIEGVPADARNAVLVHAERERAIEAAIAGAAPGDVVIIAGKGHERTQIGVGPDGRPQTRVFDDRVHAARALSARAESPARAGA